MPSHWESTVWQTSTDHGEIGSQPLTNYTGHMLVKKAQYTRKCSKPWLDLGIKDLTTYQQDNKSCWKLVIVTNTKELEKIRLSVFAYLKVLNFERMYGKLWPNGYVIISKGFVNSEKMKGTEFIGLPRTTKQCMYCKM